MNIVYKNTSIDATCSGDFTDKNVRSKCLGTIGFQIIESGVRPGLPEVFPNPLTSWMVLYQLLSLFEFYVLSCKLKAKPFHRIVEKRSVK